MNDIESQHEDLRKPRGGNDGGGSVSINADPRVSRFLDLAQPIVSSLVVAGLLYFANKVGDLSDSIAQTNVQMALTRQQSTAIVEELRDHELRLRHVESEAATWSGKGLRSGPHIDLREPEKKRAR